MVAMRYSLILLALVQSMLLSGGQVLLKFALQRMGAFSWSMQFFVGQLTNWWFLGCGLCYASASLLWFYIVKHYPFSQAYPMISLSYVFGMLAAIYFFHEQVTLRAWLGVALIMAGVLLIGRN